jgi:hypothetical protein
VAPIHRERAVHVRLGETFQLAVTIFRLPHRSSCSRS